MQVMFVFSVILCYLFIVPNNHQIEKRLLRYVCVAWHAGYVCHFSYIMLSIFPNNLQIEKRLLRYV